MSDKISVIVPVYSVEQYLDRCVISIINQSYKNLEIILVDDGSPDNCPVLCDNWGKRDRRIKVVHKKNGGLASARNAGLDLATGKYISFVDSDDYIDKDLYLNNIKFFEEKNVDVVGFGIKEICGATENIISMSEGVMYSEEAIKHLLLWDGKVRSFAWNKIYKKEVINKFRFVNELKFGEDTPFVFLALASSEKYYQNSTPYYFYIRRDDSLIGNEFTRNKLLTIKASQIIYKECITDKIKYKDYAECSIAYNCLALTRLMYLTQDWRSRYFDSYLQIQKILRSCSTIKALKNFGLLRSMRFLAVKYTPTIYEKICKYRNNHRKNKNTHKK